MNNKQPPQTVGIITQNIIDLLQLSFEPGTPILLGESNIDHMRTEHPEDFAKYFDELENILKSPDFVAVHPKNGSVQFVKVFDNLVMVGVRVSSSGALFARTLFSMSDGKIKSYKKRNALIKV